MLKDLMAFKPRERPSSWQLNTWRRDVYDYECMAAAVNQPATAKRFAREAAELQRRLLCATNSLALENCLRNIAKGGELPEFAAEVNDAINEYLACATRHALEHDVDRYPNGDAPPPLQAAIARLRSCFRSPEVLEVIEQALNAEAASLVAGAIDGTLQEEPCRRERTGRSH